MNTENHSKICISYFARVRQEMVLAAYNAMWEGPYSTSCAKPDVIGKKEAILVCLIKICRSVLIFLWMNKQDCAFYTFTKLCLIYLCFHLERYVCANYITYKPVM